MHVVLALFLGIIQRLVGKLDKLRLVMNINPVRGNAGREGEAAGRKNLDAVEIGIVQLLRSLLMKERALWSS